MSRTRFRGAIPVALLASFAAGALIDGWLRTHGPPKPAQTEASEASDAFIAAPPSIAKSSTPDAAVRTPAPVATAGNAPSGPIRIPIDGEDIESFKHGFTERRGGDRPHEAVDMLAPRNTPVHAVESGTIAKLFTSKAGGLTIYQFNPSGRLCYYYAHLDHYADGLKDGQAITAGEIIGYVGTTGNAPPGTPHLHFAVFELNADKHWWQGRPLDPYQLFKDKG